MEDLAFSRVYPLKQLLIHCKLSFEDIHHFSVGVQRCHSWFSLYITLGDITGICFFDTQPVQKYDALWNVIHCIEQHAALNCELGFYRLIVVAKTKYLYSKVNDNHL